MQETAVMEEESKILSSVENGVGRLIFNNPQRRNAFGNVGNHFKNPGGF